MTGWQRFFILILCYFLVLMLFPYYPASGVPFILISFGVWCAVIIVLTIFINMFAIYKLHSVNALITVVFVACIFYFLLSYLPQHERPSPLNQLKFGDFPTMADAKMGVKRMTFSRDFHKEAYQRETRYGSGQQLGTKQEMQGARSSATGH